MFFRRDVSSKNCFTVAENIHLFSTFFFLKEILVVMETFEQYYRIPNILNQVFRKSDSVDSTLAPLLKDLVLSCARRNHSVFVCKKSLMDDLRTKFKVEDAELQVYGFSSEFLVDLGVVAYGFEMGFEDSGEIDSSFVNESYLKQLFTLDLTSQYL